MSRRLELAGLIAILLASFALRVWLLGSQNIWWDEGLAFWAIRRGWTEMTLWTAADVHPPLFFWLLKAWVSLVGETELAARFLSLIYGVITVAGLYLLGKTLLGKRVALLAAALMAVSRFHVWWSQELRMYILATLWGVFSLYAFCRWCQSAGWWPGTPPSNAARPWKWPLLYVLFTVLGLYSLYLFVTVILVQNLVLLILLLRAPGHRRWGILGPWVTSQLVAVLSFLPWLVLATRSMRSWSVAEPFASGTFLRLYATLLTLGISTYVEHYTLLVAPFVAIVGLGVLLQWMKGLARNDVAPADNAAPVAPGSPSARLIVALLLMMLAVPALIVYLLTLPRGLFYAPRVEARYLVLFAPAFYLLLAWSLHSLHQYAPKLGLLATVLVLGLFAWTLPGHYQGRYLRDEGQTLVRTIAAYAEPGDAVLLLSGNRYPLFEYYYYRLPASTYLPPVHQVPSGALFITAQNVDAELAPLVSQYSRFWLAQVGATLQDPDSLAVAWLNAHLTSTIWVNSGYDSLTLYASNSSVAQPQAVNLAPQHAMNAALAPGVTCTGYDLLTREFRPGDTVAAAVYYAAAQPVELTASLADVRGRVLESRNVPVAATEQGRLLAQFHVYPATPAGRYHFVIQSDGGQAINLGEVIINGTAALQQIRTVPVARRATLGGRIELLGYALSDTQGKPVDAIRPGQTLTLDLYWRANVKLGQGYTVFAHLIGTAFNPATDGPLWAGHDGEPVNGGYPTQQWFVDQVILDRHTLVVPPDAPPGDYELEVGMYLLETMERLKVTATGGPTADRVVLGTFPLRP